MPVNKDTSITLLTPFGYINAFHATSLGKEGVILQSPNAIPSPCPVRIQSSCLFSEGLTAIDCDCAFQLRQAISMVYNSGRFVIYLYDEGRGIGLAQKFAAIRLQQDKNIDTRTAFHSMEFEADPRSFAAYALLLQEVLPTLNHPVELITNNKLKSDKLKFYGINVTSTRSILIKPNNTDMQRYLEQKSHSLGHDIKL